MSERLEGMLVLPDGLARGALSFDSHIRSIDTDEPTQPPAAGAALPEAVRSGALPLLLPGFIDAHVHGGGGADTMDGPDGVRRLARFHLAHGTTTLLPTTITNPWPAVIRALHGVAAVRGPGSEDLPDLPGAHLEGPFISPERLGAQPPHALAPTPERIDEILATGAVRVVTMAPEIEGALEAAVRFARAGVRVSVGHTNGGYREAARMVEAVHGAGGIVGFTHLFNAMSALGSRAPGTVGAALDAREAFAEIIFDLHHVHPVAFRLAAATKPDRLLLITDAIRACGMPEGETELGGQRVLVRGGAARLPGGSLAGSVLTLDVALRNAVEAGLPLPRASRMASGAAADYLGLHDRGRLAEGLRADVVALDGGLSVREVWTGGRRAAA